MSVNDIMTDARNKALNEVLELIEKHQEMKSSEFALILIKEEIERMKT